VVIWAEQLEVVMVAIVITGKKSHHIVWQIGTNILEEPAAPSFSISVSHAGRDGANIRRQEQALR
jgi:hypothetical protein